MIWTSIDKIVRRTLLAKRLPIHYYVEFLVHATSCLRELTMDTLKVINTVELPLDTASNIYLPDDCLDWVAIGQRIGQRVRPVAQTNNITQLTNSNSAGATVPFGQSESAAIDAFSTWPAAFYWTNVDEFGEYLGRAYGYDTESASPNGFKFFREEGRIQFTETFTGGTAMIDYISDGQNLDNATRVNPYAHATIEAYINWKRSLNADNDQSPEARTFKHERKRLKARISGITIADIKRAVQSGYRLSIKN